MYFNDHEPFVTAWLRTLWPDATVDERDIRTLGASDLAGHRRVHLFAGIGGWEYALQLADWPDEEEVWTGSCPCQPFSTAGKRLGTADTRHLWPEFYRLIAECRPPVVLGEQVASRAGRQWLTGIRLDLERLGYAIGAADLPAASVAAPHLRQRLFWVADAEFGTTERYGHKLGSPSGRLPSSAPQQRIRADARHGRDASGLADAPWATAEWLPCRDGKARRTQPGLCPVAHGIPGRVGRLRAYGNAIVPQVAAQFIRAYQAARQSLTRREETP